MDIVNPVIQYGVWGVVGVLLGIQVWLIKRILSLLIKNQQIVSENTAAFRELVSVIDKTNMQILDTRTRLDDQGATLRSMNERLLARPCLIPRT